LDRAHLCAPPFPSLLCRLAEHLNAEVCLRAITDIPSALQWLRSTYAPLMRRSAPLFSFSFLLLLPTTCCLHKPPFSPLLFGVFLCLPDFWAFPPTVPPIPSASLFCFPLLMHHFFKHLPPAFPLSIIHPPTCHFDSEARSSLGPLICPKHSLLPHHPSHRSALLVRNLQLRFQSTRILNDVFWVGPKYTSGARPPKMVRIRTIVNGAEPRPLPRGPPAGSSGCAPLRPAPLAP